MKNLILSLLLISSTSAFSDVSIKIAGKGAWICSSEGIKDYPTLARGKSKLEASILAQQECAKIEGSDFHCEVTDCEKDKNSDNLNIEINFTVTKQDTIFSISLDDGSSSAICTASAFTKSFMAEAPTKLEAAVLVRQTCIQAGNHGMHCDVDQCDDTGTGYIGTGFIFN